MQIIDSEKGFYKVIDENQDSYIAQKLFLNRKPRSAIIVEIKKKIENLIAERRDLFTGLPYIHFERIELIDGEYCLLRKGSEIYRPLYLYIKENEVSLEKVKDWIITIGEMALEAEEHGICWQGITMNSLWITPDGKLMIMDPDIVNEITGYQELPGITPIEVYQAPEIIKGVSWNQQALIYSTAIIMYYLVTGETPFTMEKKSDYSKSDLVHDIINTSPIEPSYLNPRIAGELSDLIMSALEKEPESRIKDWKTFLQDLKKSKVKADKEEEERARERAARVIRVSKGKKGLHRFLYKYKNTIFVIITLIFVVSFVSIFNRREPFITADTSPGQVGEFFYQAINEKNTVLLEECTTLDLKRLDTLVAEIYAIERVRTAYGMGDDSDFTIFGITDLEISQTNDEPVTFKADYYFFFHEIESDSTDEEPVFKRYEALMSDIIGLEKVDGIWRITSIEGSIVSIIEGRLLELFE